jgi:hypothetical protein
VDAAPIGERTHQLILKNHRYGTSSEGNVLAAKGFGTSSEGYVLPANGFGTSSEGNVLVAKGFGTSSEDNVLATKGFGTPYNVCFGTDNYIITSNNACRCTRIDPVRACKGVIANKNLAADRGYDGLFTASRIAESITQFRSSEFNVGAVHVGAG